MRSCSSIYLLRWKRFSRSVQRRRITFFERLWRHMWRYNNDYQAYLTSTKQISCLPRSMLHNWPVPGWLYWWPYNTVAQFRGECSFLLSWVHENVLRHEAVRFGLTYVFDVGETRSWVSGISRVQELLNEYLCEDEKPCFWHDCY